MFQAPETLESAVEAFSQQVQQLVEARGGQCEAVTALLSELEPRLQGQTNHSAEVLRIVVEQLEPWLADRLLMVVPGPDVRADSRRMPIGLLDAATLYARCRPWMAQAGIRSGLGQKIDAGMQKFSDAGRAAVLMFDMPDLQPIALGLLRVEVLGTLLDQAGCTAEQKILDRWSGALARDVLRRVVLLVDAYLKDPPSPAPRIDFAGVATRFDDLVVIVSRVFEASRVAERNTFVRSIGSELLDEFGSQFERLTSSLLRAATTLHKPEFSAASHRAVLMQLARLHGLYLLLDDRDLSSHGAVAAKAIVDWCEKSAEEDLKRLHDGAAVSVEKSRHVLEMAQSCGRGDTELMVALKARLAAIGPTAA